MNHDEFIGNISTILKIIILTIGPSIAVYIGTDEQTVITFLTACLTFSLAVIDAKYPNNMRLFDNNKTINYDDEDVILNDEYTTSINEVELDE